MCDCKSQSGSGIFSSFFCGFKKGISAPFKAVSYIADKVHHTTGIPASTILTTAALVAAPEVAVPLATSGAVLGALGKGQKGTGQFSGGTEFGFTDANYGNATTSTGRAVF